MFSINLLPAYEKRVVRLEEVRRLTVFFAVLALGIIGVGFVFLIPSLALTRLGAQELSRSLELEEAAARHGETGDTIARTRDIRAAIRDMRAYAAAPPRASVLLERFFAPNHGIAVRSFTVRNDGQISLAGYAPTRAALLTFEGALRSSNRFYEITFPLSNITRERDIQFFFQGKLKQEYGL